MKSKVAGIVFIIGSLYYMIAEAISAFAFNDALFRTYVFHTHHRFKLIVRKLL